MPIVPLKPRTKSPRYIHDGSPDPLNRSVRILIVEDVEYDAELIAREIGRAGIIYDIVRVDTESAFRKQFDALPPIVVLSDYSLPNFDGFMALEISRQLNPDVPFIFVSGVMGEEYAVRALKDGATDYVLKNNILRLPAAIERAIKDATERIARKRLEQELKESELRHRKMFQSNPHPMWVYDIQTLRFLDVNDAAVARLGYNRDEFLKMTIRDIRPNKDIPRLLDRIPKQESGLNQPEIWEHVTKTGEVIEVEIASHDIVLSECPARIVVAYDNTQRRRAEQRLEKSEKQFRALTEQAADGIYVSDSKGTFLFVNSQGCELLGYGESELVGLNVMDTYLENELPIYKERLKAATKGKAMRFERNVKRKDGTTFPAEISFKLLDDGTMQGRFHDISDRKRDQEHIVKLQRIHAVLSSINSALIRIKNKKELFAEACRIASQHGAFKFAWIGLVEGDKLVPTAWAGTDSEFFERIVEAGSHIKLSPGGLANRAVQRRHSVFDNDITDNPNLDFMRREVVDRGCRSGIALPLIVSGEAIGIFMLYCDQKDFFDEEEVKLLEELAGDVSFAIEVIAQRERVDFLAYYDSLTGLPNRTLFLDRLTQHLNGTIRDQSSVVLIVLNIDRFRMVNDTLGRQAGDELLQEITERLRGIVRDQDSVARIGADTFALAFPGNWRTQEVTHTVTLRNKKLFGHPFLLCGEELRVSGTAGIAISPGDGRTSEELFAHAEAALRNAKIKSERFLYYRPEMNVRVAENLRLESQLRRAIENNELVLWYQPKVNLKTGKITGFEALMRWKHPESGMIPPIHFIPLMEQTGLILEAGNWALAEVARNCAQWSRNGLAIPRIAVNVSPLQLRQKEFVNRVIEAAAAVEDAGAGLDLEITESVIMENVDAVIPVLQTIRGLGVEISIDDFGTGYSSLAYIARLPIHALKIDRSFVVGMTQNQDSLAIVRSVISLAHSLRLLVVAEGMETEDQATTLRTLNCDQAQGYLISAPVASNDVPALIERLAQ